MEPGAWSQTANVETVRAVKELIRGEEAVGLVRRGARREVGRGECSAEGPACQKRLPEDFLVLFGNASFLARTYLEKRISHA